MSLLFRETQLSYLIAIKYIASLGYILLAISGKIKHSSAKAEKTD